MSDPDLYRQLLAEAAKREAELEKARLEFERSQEAARKAAEALRNAAMYLKPPEATTKPSSPATVAALQEPRQPIVAPQPSFIDVVARAVEGMDKQITTALVFDELSAKNFPLGDDPRTKISTALMRLEKKGTLTKVVEGSIGRPHVYERTKK